MRNLGRYFGGDQNPIDRAVDPSGSVSGYITGENGQFGKLQRLVNALQRRTKSTTGANISHSIDVPPLPPDVSVLADASGDSVTFSFIPVNSSILAGFMVYRANSDAPDSAVRIGFIGRPANFGAPISVTDRPPSADTYYYWVSAASIGGSESAKIGMGFATTISSSGTVTGTGTTGYITKFTNGPSGVIGDSPMHAISNDVLTAGYMALDGTTINNSTADGYVVSKIDSSKTDIDNEWRGYQATMRYTRTTADANIGGLGWDVFGYGSAIVTQNMNMPADSTLRGQMKNYQAELYFPAKSGGTNYVAKEAYNYLADLSQTSSSSSVTKWAGYVVTQPCSVAGSASSVTTGYGVWIQNLDDTPHSLVQGNAAAIKIDGLNEYGRISWTGSNIMEPSSGILQLYGSTRVQTPSGTGLYVGGASADSGVNAGSYSISGRLLIDDTATDLGTPTTILTVDPSNGGYVRFRRGTVGTEDAGTPSAGFVSLYTKNDGGGLAALYYKQSDGTIVGPLGQAGVATVTGSGTTNQMTKWTGATALGDSLLKDDGGGALLATGSGTHFDTGTGAGAGYYVGGVQLIDQSKNIGNVVDITASGNIAGGTGNHNVSAGQGASGGFFFEGVQALKYYGSGSHTSTLGGLEINGTINAYTTGAELTLNLSGANGRAVIASTNATGGPEMRFDHRGAGNTGIWTWQNGTAAANQQMLLGAAGDLQASGGIYAVKHFSCGAAYGYQINGGATLGNYLRGNGTYFISNTIQAGDLPNHSASLLTSGTFAINSLAFSGDFPNSVFDNGIASTSTVSGSALQISGTTVINSSKNIDGAQAKWILPFTNSAGGSHIDSSGNMFGATIQCTVNFKSSDGSTGATFGPSAVTSITVKNGIVTAIS